MSDINNNKENEQQFKELIKLGDSLFKQSKLEEAHRPYSEAIKLKQKHSQGHGQLDNVLEKTGNLDRAIAN